MTSIPCAVSVNAERWPALPAIIWSGRTITWEALNNYVHSTSRYLKEISVKSGMRVILVADGTPAFLIVLFSLWRIGATACPLPASFPDTDISRLHDLIVPDFIISPRHFKRLWGCGRHWVDIEQVVAYGYNDSFLGSDKVLRPMLGADQPVLLRLTREGAAWHSQPLSYIQLQGDPRDLGVVLEALSSGTPLTL